jgi:hypothetical protein
MSGNAAQPSLTADHHIFPHVCEQVDDSVVEPGPGGIMPLNPSQKRRSTLQFTFASAAAVLAVAAVAWPQWIEAFGVDPDRGNGTAEWAIPTLLLLIAVFLGLAGYRRRRLEVARSAAS